jgi:hypothetical protein
VSYSKLIYVRSEVACKVFAMTMQGGTARAVKEYLESEGIGLFAQWRVVDIGAELEDSGRWFLEIRCPDNVSPSKEEGGKQAVR